jgi:cytolysin-activating lysine-acyltransferase
MPHIAPFGKNEMTKPDIANDLSEGLLRKLPPQKLALLQGELFQLFVASDRHDTLSLREFAMSILPPIHFDQFRIYHANGRPVGFVSWAMFRPEDGKGYMAGDFDFSLDKWTAGDQLWFIDYIAPFGHAIKMAEDLRDNVFPNSVAYAPDLDDKTGRKRVRKYRGRKRGGLDQQEDMESFLREL